MSILGNLTGNVERAILEIYDERDRAEVSTDMPVIKTRGLSISALGAAAAMAGNALGVKTGIGSLLNSSVKRFSVQFNPSAITIYAQGGGMAQVMDLNGTDRGVSYKEMTSRIQVNIPLIFDAVYNKDAFMAEKAVFNPVSMATGVATAAFNAITGQEYSVQNEVEAFIAALRNENTRKVSFIWGNKMNYFGVLYNMASTYTMFNPHGYPIRAKVNMGILCSTDETIKKGAMGQWQEHYEEQFINNGTSSSFANVAQKAGNLVNISY